MSPETPARSAACFGVPENWETLLWLPINGSIRGLRECAWSMHAPASMWVRARTAVPAGIVITSGRSQGQNTTLGLVDYLRADPDPGYIVWAGLRKGQIADQDGLSFVPLHGRQKGNCRKLPEAHELGSCVGSVQRGIMVV